MLQNLSVTMMHDIKKINRAQACPYCESRPMLVTGQKVYPHRSDLHSLYYWWCDAGHEPAYVGCHGRSMSPLGRLADKELRAAKFRAHSAFDEHWRDKRTFRSRTRAYNWLAQELKINQASCHIGMFDVEQCKKVVDLCAALTNQEKET